MSVDWTNLTGAVATVIAAGAAVASWRAAKSSNRTSNLLAKIEKERRHAELRPVFSVRCEKYPNDDIFYVILKLDGPAGLERVDTLKISIRDNKRMPKSDPTGQRTEQELANQIWAPFCFSPNVDGSSVDGRSVPYADLKLGDECRFQLQRVSVPSWNHAGGVRWWQEQGIEPFLKISILCQNSEMTPWTIPWEIETPLEKIEREGNA